MAIGSIDRFVRKILSFAKVMIQQQNLGGWLVVWWWLSILALLFLHIYFIHVSMISIRWFVLLFTFIYQNDAYIFIYIVEFRCLRDIMKI